MTSWHMTPWEDRIINAFVERYPASAAAKLDGGINNSNGENHVLRISAEKIFPNFNNASPDEKDSFLDAAKSLEGQQILTLKWVRHRKDNELSALICPDMEKLYRRKGSVSPKVVAEAARAAARAAAKQITVQITSGQANENSEKSNAETSCAFFNFLSENITASDAAKGINAESINDLAKLFLVISKPVNLTLRALSVSLYNDSKRLEALINSFRAIFTRAEHHGVIIPELSFLDRSFPETSIAGKIIINIENSQALINESGAILTLPLLTIEKIKSILVCDPEPAGEKSHSVLMIENKETFFTLAAAVDKYTCILYIGGHPNRAVRAIVTLLAKSGFTFYHSGDLDPDGILILQELQDIVCNADIAGLTVTPVYMDTLTFDRYLEHARKLEPSMLRRTSLIKNETRALPGIAELITKIETSGKGIEQEIIEYENLSNNH